ncbi:hypothetical protein [Pseudonocardia sp. ICBG1142]|uniref:hypothetical protein n=1 Tax=Pseudonocardia sp. ICBG1142 TaxID=2846760 RepID=UPI001CF6A4B0|nr:hypothetical protein [Pseudonocardia sp. ICBG1142]
MYYATGFRRDEIQDLAALVHEQDQRNGDWPATGLGRRSGIVLVGGVTLAYLRGNRVQWSWRKPMGCPQSTVSRAIAGVDTVAGAGAAECRSDGGGGFVPIGSTSRLIQAP